MVICGVTAVGLSRAVAARKRCCEVTALVMGESKKNTLIAVIHRAEFDAVEMCQSI